MAVPEWLAGRAEIRHVESRPALSGEAVDWPGWVPEQVRTTLRGAGIERPWRHQIAGAAAVMAGRSVAVATPTATGKTLVYLLPALVRAAEAATGADPTRLAFRRAAPTALYIAPTKALAHDQLARLTRMTLPGWSPACLDGDCDQAERRYAREFATFVLTNPDMLHRSVLPQADRWRRFLGNLRLVVVDESHRYRGSFGAHTAAVLRRLRRLCAAAGSDPAFVCTSATTVDAAAAATRLTGVDDVVEVTAATSPRPALDFVVWQPGSAGDLPGLMAQSVDHERQTLGFVASRRLAESVAERLRGLVPGRRVVAYRAGYLPDERRALESGLRDGSIAAAVATNALELGIDLGGLDTVVMDGFPGTLAAMWQRAGRAGRRDRDALVILVPAEQPLDAYLTEHPELLFDAPVEATVLHPENPYILGPHLAAAAQELPLTTADAAYFGPGFLPAVKALTAQGVLRERPSGWFWTRPERAVDAIDLRAIGGRPVEIIEEATGRVVGTVDPAAADATVHEGAVYVHQGEPWLVDAYAPADRTALVRAAPTDLGYVTQALSGSEVSILGTHESAPLGAGMLSVGPVRMTSRVTEYLRRDAETLAVWDRTPLDLPAHTLATQAVWWTLPDEVLRLGAAEVADPAAAAHAAEHAAIGMLPVFAPCDRWDVGGLSVARHPDTGLLTVFVVDGYPGGAGYAAAAFRRAGAWLTATLERLRTCGCPDGCPRCVMSPTCGNGNQHLDKPGATTLLRLLVEG
ncbi:DEAD/DEAH box helicase [Propionicicella superfundia]|uniref:DEAD/DEAH box helicase n=1 Tax=Propionicicella superfundia TaxID=348582 RepID=UPI000423E9CA|nr:DEAD/DEAH box helicase [Propionicicella superfundia]